MERRWPETSGSQGAACDLAQPITSASVAASPVPAHSPGGSLLCPSGLCWHLCSSPGPSICSPTPPPEPPPIPSGFLVTQDHQFLHPLPPPGELPDPGPCLRRGCPGQRDGSSWARFASGVWPQGKRGEEREPGRDRGQQGEGSEALSSTGFLSPLPGPWGPWRPASETPRLRHQWLETSPRGPGVSAPGSVSHGAGGREVRLEPCSSSAGPPRAPGQWRGAAGTWPPDYRTVSPSLATTEQGRGAWGPGHTWSGLSFLK